MRLVNAAFDAMCRAEGSKRAGAEGHVPARPPPRSLHPPQGKWRGAQRVSKGMAEQIGSGRLASSCATHTRRVNRPVFLTR
jgi:hypothetical protein